MKEYRVQAYFSGDVYKNRTYRRKIVVDLTSARKLLCEALVYYTNTSCYAPYFEKVAIEEREVTDWNECECGKQAENYE